MLSKCASIVTVFSPNSCVKLFKTTCAVTLNINCLHKAGTPVNQSAFIYKLIWVILTVSVVYRSFMLYKKLLLHWLHPYSYLKAAAHIYVGKSAASDSRHLAPELSAIAHRLALCLPSFNRMPWNQKSQCLFLYVIPLRVCIFLREYLISPHLFPCSVSMEEHVQ